MFQTRHYMCACPSAKAGADDTVVGFEHRSDADLFRAQLRIRMAEFALELHPEKTRLIEFGRKAGSDRAARGDSSTELRRRWHQSVAEQGAWLGSVVRGFLAYHAVPTNARAISAFHYHVVDLWRRALRRRSQRDHTTWRLVDKLADRWLPKPRISHPWPSQRFRVKHPRWEPYAGMPLVRFCAGGAQ
jgi:RNA-directed DNA polymerase